MRENNGTNDFLLRIQPFLQIKMFDSCKAVKNHEKRQLHQQIQQLKLCRHSNNTDDAMNKMWTRVQAKRTSIHGEIQKHLAVCQKHDMIKCK